ncbi:hypothetical protein Hypma_007757 [Hypsizygus marmoreus]|uniref:Trichodiene oxygenase n=1 Tax=Hypsizygus marmoreus TaxID=39966 RepID=A0A369JZ34_HYPMA|nr:hypothetical protein Hypma_007757 [Hypsizygus marmoreus]
MFSSVSTAILLPLGPLVVYGFYLGLQRLFFHPLLKFPGPKLAALTYMYMAYYDIEGTMVDHLEQLHETYGPVVRIGPEQLHFNDPRAYEDIYAIGSKFTKEARFYDCFNEPESSFGFIDIKKAKQRKDVMRPLFSRRAILKLENVIQTTTDQLVSALLSHSSPASKPKPKPVNLHLGYLSTTMEIILAYCFARSYDAVLAPDFRHPILIALKSVGSLFFVLQHFPFLLPLFTNMPAWFARLVAPKSLAYGEIIADLSAQINQLVKNPGMLENAEHEIIYHQLLTPGKDGGEIPSKRSLLHEATVMIGAGSETVGNTCNIGSFYVLSNPTIQKKLVDELCGIWPDVDATVNFEKLEKLPYLTAIIKESLRMSHGVVSPLPRVVPTPTIIAGMQIPANTVVAMGATFMHYDSRVFEDPFVFRPERWVDQDVQKAREMENFLVPFSKGPRSCLGINLAWAELYLMFANVFRKVEMEVYETTAEDFKFNAYLMPQYRGRQFRVIVKQKRTM